jgi:hypothetical protein
MAKVRIQGHASGTGILTVTAPNTSTDRTITLPDSTGTLLDSTSTLDATKVSGTHASFTSTGIDDNADATAITISSSEKVRVGGTATSDKALLSTYQDNTAAGTTVGGTNLAMAMQHYGGANTVVQMGMGYCVNHPPAVIGYKVETNTNFTKGDIFFATRDDTADIAPTERLRITVDGRGLSQFTAKAWVNLNGTGTPAINGSHNVSSITDNSTGDFSVNFTNAMANTDYTMACAGGDVDEHVAWRSYGTASYRGTTFARIGCMNHTGAYRDRDGISAIFFGD